MSLDRLLWLWEPQQAKESAEQSPTFTHWALNVAHDESVLIVQELDANLRDLRQGQK